MTSRCGLVALVSPAILAATLVSCSDLTAPVDAYVSFLVTVTGGDVDDRFDITSHTAKFTVAPNSIVTKKFPEGRQTFELKDVADNCTVEGGSSVQVKISSREVSSVKFSVDCARTGITIGAPTNGQDFPPAFQILIPSQPTALITPNGVQSISRLQPGRYLVKLRTEYPNCAVAGDSIVAADVVSRQMTNVMFNVQCVRVPRTGVIAFVQYPRILLMNADGSNTADITRGTSPSWSRDGTRIVYSTTECDYYSYNCTGSLAMIDPATDQVTTLSAAKYGLEPDWSPTDDVIAYVYASTGRTHLLDLTTSVSIEVPLPANMVVYHPSWSPDGKQLVALCYPPNASSGLCIFNRDGSNLRFIDTGSGFASEPVWSPDGRQIVFSRYFNQQTVAVINADGTNLRVLATGSSPSWSPDSRQIIFSVGSSGLFVMNDDGSLARRVSTGAHSHPSWRP